MSSLLDICITQYSIVDLRLLLLAFLLSQDSKWSGERHETRGESTGFTVTHPSTDVDCKKKKQSCCSLKIEHHIHVYSLVVISAFDGTLKHISESYHHLVISEIDCTFASS